MSFTADTSEVTAAADQLTAAADHLENTRELLAAAGAQVEQLAAPRTPRRTGKLAASVSVTVDGQEASVRWGVGYAVFVNFGTIRMPARPFATDALEAAESAIETLTVTWATGILDAA